MKPMNYGAGERNDVSYISRGTLADGFNGVCKRDAAIEQQLQATKLLEAHAKKVLLGGYPLAIQSGFANMFKAGAELTSAGYAPVATKISAAMSTPVVPGNAELTSARPGRSLSLKAPTLQR